ncbi:MAG TPA: hypothetical protein VLT92_02715, partial [Burkholderiales bacterium]|nr:hypothetical protein [Burkholderiales bacterium]
IRVVPSELPGSPSWSCASAYGIYYNPTLGAAAESKISNVHIAGYYQKLPVAIGQALNATNFRDWGVPNLPQADTAGTTAGPAATYYRACTMYGNSA